MKTCKDERGLALLRCAQRRFYASAAAMDGAFFLIMVATPFKVLDLGGGALELGLAAAIGSLSYIIAAPIAGRLSDRINRSLLCLSGGLLLIVCALMARQTASLQVLLALQLLMGLGKALYWPAVQATLADLSPAFMRVGVLGCFNVAWSSGKTTGFLLGGLLLGLGGFGAVYLTGAGAVIAAFVLLPRGRLLTGAERTAIELACAESPTASTHRAQTHSAKARLRTFLTMAWMANTATYSAFGILHFHLPQWFAHRGWDTSHYGWFLGAILASQTLVFLLLISRLGLMWSSVRLWLPQAGGMLALLAIPLLGDFGQLLAVAPVIGLACGVSYAASIFYSLEAPSARGRNAGIHEGLIGAGGFLPPLLAGLAIRAGMTLSAPYLLAGLLLLASLAFQIIHHRRRLHGWRS